MNFSVSLLTTGSEILDGRVLDTNSNYVAKQLSLYGLKLNRVLAVDDDVTDLLDGIAYLHRFSPLVITSGGLGPTSDDLTRDIVSAYCKVPLEESPQARKHLEEFYAMRKRHLDFTNLKQAMLPKGSQMIPNPNGTAPGFIASNEFGNTICSLSGVPREFYAMFNATVLPLILEKSGSIPSFERRSFKLFGIPESMVGKLVVELKLPSEITVSYRAAFPEVHLVLKSAPRNSALEEAAQKVRSSQMRNFIFTEQADESFPDVLQRLLTDKKATLAVAESCTGGMLGELLTSRPGASSTFIGGIVAYSNSVKQNLLEVPANLIDTYGAVSSESAARMAENVRLKFGTTFGLSVTGVAGPGGGSEEKPVGTFFVGLASQNGVATQRSLFISERENIRRYATHVAVEMLRRSISNLPLEDSYPVVFK